MVETEILPLECWRPLYFVSTISTVGPDSSAEDSLLDAARLLRMAAEPNNGYACSKAVAETMVRRAMLAGAPCAIIRPG